MTCNNFIIFFCVFAVSGKFTREHNNCISIESRLNSTNSEATTSSDQTQQGCSRTCCNAEIEEKLIKQEIVLLQREVEKRNEQLNVALDNIHGKFDVFFVSLIDNAYSSLDVAFSRAYGDLYLNNSEVFMRLFEDLKDYYRGSAYDVKEIFYGFFTALMQKGFELLHPDQTFSSDYLRCIAENMDTIQPFARHPQAISTQVQRSFTNTRKFVDGLKTGKRVKVGKFEPSYDCKTALTKMLVCPACANLSDTRPCPGFCLNVLNGCFVDHHHLNLVWKDYTDAMAIAISRLKSRFNIVTVLESIEVKILAAVSLLQDNKSEISDTVYRICGKGVQKQFSPHNGSPAINHPSIRKTNDNENHSENQAQIKDQLPNKFRIRNFSSMREERHLERSKDFKNPKKVEMVFEPPLRSLDQNSQDKSYNQLASLISVMKALLKKYRNHWGILSSTICDWPAEKATLCWNGNTTETYSNDLANGSLDQQQYKPEANPSSHRMSNSTLNHVNNLKTVISLLVPEHFSMNDIDDDEDNDEFGYYSGGSGEGSANSDENNNNLNLNSEKEKEDKCCGVSSLQLNLFLLLLPFFFVLLP